jgi:hypothetical protein
LFSLTGLNKNNYPNKDETILLANFIHSEFGNYTIEEIKLAFNLAIKKELTMFMGKDESVEHYQTFSPVYFSKIMIGFKKYKEHSLKPILAKISNLPETEEVSDYDFMVSNFVNKFDKFLKGAYPWKYGADIFIFDVLVKHEIINVPFEEKKEKSIEINKSLDSSKFKTLELYKLAWSNKVKMYFFNQYINELKDFEVDVLELINEKIKK